MAFDGEKFYYKGVFAGCAKGILCYQFRPPARMARADGPAGPSFHCAMS